MWMKALYIKVLPNAGFVNVQDRPIDRVKW